MVRHGFHLRKSNHIWYNNLTGNAGAASRELVVENRRMILRWPCRLDAAGPYTVGMSLTAASIEL
jgi:hypothetical protein